GIQSRLSGCAEGDHRLLLPALARQAHRLRFLWRRLRRAQGGGAVAAGLRRASCRGDPRHGEPSPCLDAVRSRRQPVPPRPAQRPARHADEAADLVGQRAEGGTHRDALRRGCGMRPDQYATAEVARSPEEYRRNATLLFVSTLTIMSGATISASLPGIAARFAEVENVALLSRLVLTLPAVFIALFSP